MTRNSLKLWPCPACRAQLQPLSPSSDYVAQAMEHARQLGVDVPAHGPAILVWAAMVAHAMTVHTELDLQLYLEAAST